MIYVPSLFVSIIFEQLHSIRAISKKITCKSQDNPEFYFLQIFGLVEIGRNIR